MENVLVALESYWSRQTDVAKRIIIAASTVLLSTVLLLAGPTAGFFQASLLGAQPDPFDGAVYPVQQTANWVKLSSTNYKAFRSGEYTYDQLVADGKAIPIPTYDTSVISHDPASLSWSGADLDVRNALLTYVTAYMGEYTAGSEPALEHEGSHLAVDIRAVKGTPVYAIANGRVEAAKSHTSNGNYIVLMHPNVPELGNPSKTTTYYSEYLHLDTMLVSAGSIVKRGQQIGTVGNTGLATTYHLHFQMDKAEAPFHPYWPFTWSEVSALGLDFFSGVNEGVGAENAVKYTIHPFEWIHANKPVAKNAAGHQAAPETKTETVVETAEPVETVATVDTTVETPVDAAVVDNVQENTSDTDATVETNTAAIPNKAAALEMVADHTALSDGQAALITVTALDAEGNQVTDYNETLEINTSVIPKGVLSSDTIVMQNGEGSFTYEATYREVVTFTVKDGDLHASTAITVTDKIGEVEGFSVQYNTNAKVGDRVDVEITSVDSKGLVTPAVISDVILVKKEGGDGTLSKTMLTYSNFTEGKTKVAFTPKEEGAYVITLASGDIRASGPVLTVEQTISASFNDVPSSHPNSEAISYLHAKGIINGYEDGSFQPERAVNRAEAMKMILGASGIEPIKAVSSVPFYDVDAKQWYAGWVEAARLEGIISGNPDGSFSPQEGLNGAEGLKIILKANDIDLSEVVVSRDPYADVFSTQWFASYYQFAKQKGLIDGDTWGKVYPSRTLTRGDVAEIMYRLLK